MFNDSDNLFSDKKGLFDDQVSVNLWKEKPIKSYKNSNIIPASIDVPPPISIVCRYFCIFTPAFSFHNKFIFSNSIVLLATKPKSAIDDLFADPESEEDSDDIFSSSKNIKKRTKEPSDNPYPANVENVSKKLLDVIASDNIATSTPESNVNSTSLFSDDENDDADLFGNSKKQSHKPTSVPSSTNSTQETNKKVSSSTLLLLV